MLKNNRPKGLVWAKPCPAPAGTVEFLAFKVRAFVRRIAAVRRAELRAKAFELAAADRIGGAR